MSETGNGGFENYLGTPKIENPLVPGGSGGNNNTHHHHRISIGKLLRGCLHHDHFDLIAVIGGDDDNSNNNNKPHHSGMLKGRRDIVSRILLDKDRLLNSDFERFKAETCQLDDDNGDDSGASPPPKPGPKPEPATGESVHIQRTPRFKIIKEWEPFYDGIFCSFKRTRKMLLEMSLRHKETRKAALLFLQRDGMSAVKAWAPCFGVEMEDGDATEWVQDPSRFSIILSIIARLAVGHRVLWRCEGLAKLHDSKRILMSNGDLRRLESLTMAVSAFLDGMLDLALAIRMVVTTQQQQQDDMDSRRLPTDASISAHCGGATLLAAYPRWWKCVHAGDLPSVTTLLPEGSLWRDIKNTGDVVGELVHLLICKTQNQKCQIRNMSSIICKKMERHRAIVPFIKDIIYASLMGLYSHARVHPPFIKRMRLRADHILIKNLDHSIFARWIMEHEKIVYYALKEFYIFQVSYCAPIALALDREPKHRLHKDLVKTAMDRVRLSVSLAPTPAHAMAESALVCHVACNIGHRHLLKLKKGRFESIVSAKMISWLCKRHPQLLPRRMRPPIPNNNNNQNRFPASIALAAEALLSGRRCAYRDWDLLNSGAGANHDSEEKLLDQISRTARIFANNLNEGCQENILLLEHQQTPDAATADCAPIVSRGTAQLLTKLIHDYQIMEIADNSIEKRAAQIFAVSPRDFAVCIVLLRMAHRNASFAVMPLTKDIAQRQIQVRRSLLRVHPWEPTPPDVGLVRYCTCGHWAENVTIPARTASTGSSAAVGTAVGASKTETGVPSPWMRSYKANAVNERLMCSMPFCGRYLKSINMIGRCVRIDTSGLGGGWTAICVICGCLTELCRPRFNTAGRLGGYLSEIGPYCGCYDSPGRPIHNNNTGSDGILQRSFRANNKKRKASGNSDTTARTPKRRATRGGRWERRYLPASFSGIDGDDNCDGQGPNAVFEDDDDDDDDYEDPTPSGCGYYGVGGMDNSLCAFDERGGDAGDPTPHVWNSRGTISSTKRHISLREASRTISKPMAGMGLSEIVLMGASQRRAAAHGSLFFFGSATPPLAKDRRGLSTTGGSGGKANATTYKEEGGRGRGQKGGPENPDQYALKGQRHDARDRTPDSITGSGCTSAFLYGAAQSNVNGFTPPRFPLLGQPERQFPSTRFVFNRERRTCALAPSHWPIFVACAPHSRSPLAVGLSQRGIPLVQTANDPPELFLDTRKLGIEKCCSGILQEHVVFDDICSMGGVCLHLCPNHAERAKEITALVDGDDRHARGTNNKNKKKASKKTKEIIMASELVVSCLDLFHSRLRAQ